MTSIDRNGMTRWRTPEERRCACGPADLLDSLEQSGVHGVSVDLAASNAFRVSSISVSRLIARSRRA